MTPLVIGSVALFAIAFAGFWSNDRAVKLLAGAAGIALLMAFGAWFLSEYQWANTTNCREAFPEEFGYRPPNWEMPPAGELADVQVWWPVGHECRGTDVDTGEYVVGRPGWSTSRLIYPALGAVVLALSAIVIRVTVRRSRTVRPD